MRIRGAGCGRTPTLSFPKIISARCGSLYGQLPSHKGHLLWKIRAPPAIPQPFKSDSYDEALLALCVKLSRRCGYANCAADSSSAKNSVDFSISLPRSVQLRWRARERPAPLFESVDDHLVGGRDARGDGNADCRPRGVACKWLAQALDSVTENLAHKRCRCKTTQRAAEEAAVSGLRRTGGRNASRLTCRPGPIGKRRPH